MSSAGRLKMMKRIAVACGLFALVAVGRVYASPASPGCCACFLPDHDSTEIAFFCTSPRTVQDSIDTENRCGDIPGAELLCRAMTDTLAPATPECVAELQRDHIICPSRPGAPVLGNLALGGLVGFLGVVGFATLRRRAARRSA
jgi:hypothetical protein